MTAEIEPIERELLAVACFGEYHAEDPSG